MKVKLNFEYQDGSYDSMVAEGELEEIQEIAANEYNRRNCKDAWSEEL